MSAFRGRIRRFVRRRGYDIITRRPVLVDLLLQRKVSVVIDVGANEGQFADWLRAWGYEGRIVSVEPIPALAAALRARSVVDPAWEIRDGALGREPGTATLNISDLSVFSSLREVLPSAEAFDARARTVSTVEVEVRCLDDLYAEIIRPGDVAFLKVDTQGNEADVLDGGTDTLSSVTGLQLELGVRPLYAGEKLAPELISRMSALGFRIAQIHPVVYDPDDGFTSLLQMDAVFVRDASEPARHPTPHPESI